MRGPVRDPGDGVLGLAGRVHRVGQADEASVRVLALGGACDPDPRDGERGDPPTERVAADDDARLIGDLRLVRGDRVLRLALRQLDRMRVDSARREAVDPRLHRGGGAGRAVAEIHADHDTAPYRTGPHRWYHRRTAVVPRGHGRAPRTSVRSAHVSCPTPPAAARPGPGGHARPAAAVALACGSGHPAAADASPVADRSTPRTTRRRPIVHAGFADRDAGADPTPTPSPTPTPTPTCAPRCRRLADLADTTTLGTSTSSTARARATAWASTSTARRAGRLPARTRSRSSPRTSRARRSATVSPTQNVRVLVLAGFSASRPHRS